MTLVSYVTNVNRNVRPHLRVHVAPVGFEFDRVILPAVDMKADKIYLLYNMQEPEEADINWPFVRNIRDNLAKSGYKVGHDLLLVRTNIFDLYECMVTIARIFGEEQRVGNQIFFNVSSGGRIPSFAGLLGCMYFGGTPYYCHPMKWDYLEGLTAPITSGMRKWELVPAHAIDRPSMDLILFLEKIDTYLTQQSTARTITRRVCADLLAEAKPDFKENKGKRESKDFNRVARMLDKLLHMDYITYGDERRRKIAPTPEGKNAVKIFSEYDRARNPESTPDQDV